MTVIPGLTFWFCGGACATLASSLEALLFEYAESLLKLTFGRDPWLGVRFVSFDWGFKWSGRTAFSLCLLKMPMIGDAFLVQLAIK